MAQPSKSKSKSKENHGTQHRASPKRTSTRVPLAPRNSDDSDTSARSGSASGRIARLEAELAKAKRQRDRANEALRAERSQPSRDTHADATAETIPRPSNASKVKMSELQDMLDIDNLTWNAIHTCTRDALSSARPDYARVWKAQKPDKFAKAYNAIEEEFPVLRRCEGQWGIDRIAKQTWGNRKSYRSCIGNSLTYHGRRAAARRNRAPQSGRPTLRPSQGPHNPALDVSLSPAQAPTTTTMA
ncbi:hypothetical protein K438DRAFT_1968650 [Mycena galopus ATCC 62051]|nr:hypothetical protein K438DRAFT_1968650 [Mycena galopus ATCC 62051]